MTKARGRGTYSFVESHSLPISAGIRTMASRCTAIGRAVGARIGTSPKFHDIVNFLVTWRKRPPRTCQDTRSPSKATRGGRPVFLRLAITSYAARALLFTSQMRKLVQMVPPRRNMRTDSRGDRRNSAHQTQDLLTPVRYSIHTTTTKLNLSRELVADIKKSCTYTDETIRQSLRLLTRVTNPPPW